MGLAPDPEAEMMYRYLQLAFTPPRWDGESAHPPTVHFIRYDNPERPGEVRPAWLDEHRDQPAEAEQGHGGREHRSKDDGGGGWSPAHVHDAPDAGKDPTEPATSRAKRQLL